MTDVTGRITLFKLPHEPPSNPVLQSLSDRRLERLPDWHRRRTFKVNRES